MRARSLISLGSVLLLAACSSAPKSEQATPPSPVDGVVSLSANKSQNFPKPVVSPMAVIPVPSVPGLITPTNARMRVPTIVTGRTDPFAAIATAPIKLISTNKPAVALPSPLPAPTQNRLPTFKTPPLATVPLNGTSLPPTSLPSLPSVPVSPTSLADTIEISGVVKVGSKWSVIVKEPEAQTSRYVNPGSYLANGQVLVKRIVASAGSDPIVVLQQNGVEITRAIGSGSDRLASK
ncbi:hypothetical protein H6F86_28420 [Phormidium sp. FACHB-592]|uniref:Uncharacterized protein n=1 Tax=Stenomitos frigidus AS-A4 TaxID=2933935 RepID=A0ABV0KFE1_9CYAN|nr:hypothetical protein [Phormidium sp. FACHB-592]MBD2077743.1 hypothetical protein [Phormidium sp. FACHB-592]